MALSVDLRERVVSAVVNEGLSRVEAAKRFGVGIASAVRWVARFLTTGEVAPSPMGGDRRSGRIEAHRDYLLGLIGRQPDVTLLEIRDRLIANCGECFSPSVLWRFFRRHGITVKKKTAHAEEQQRGDVLKQRQVWFAGQPDLDPTKLVFVDETSASTNMARKYGRCRRGRRLRAAVPHGHYKTVTLVAGLRLSGLVAQKAFDRPINAASFEEWVENRLAPTLSKGDIVVMDNLTQGPPGRAARQGGRRRGALPAALQPRHEPHREGLFPAQGLLAQECRTNRRRPVGRPRRRRGHFQPRPMRQLFQRQRIRPRH